MSRGWLAIVLFAAAVLMPCAAVTAQDEDEDAAKAAAAATAIVQDPTEDPLVRTLFESNPSTPAELVRAIKILVDIKRPKLAKPLVKKLLAAKPAPRDWDQLLEQFGTPTFMDFATVPELAPEIGKLVEAVLAGSQTYREDPQRLAKMIGALRARPTNELGKRRWCRLSERITLPWLR